MDIINLEINFLGSENADEIGKFLDVTLASWGVMIMILSDHKDKRLIIIPSLEHLRIFPDFHKLKIGLITIKTMKFFIEYSYIPINSANNWYEFIFFVCGSF